MLSSDKNIESIVHLVESLKEYGSLRMEKAKFDVADKTTRLVSGLVLVAALSMLLIFVLLFVSITVAIAIYEVTGSLLLSFGVVSAAYLVLFILVIVKRKSWIERPVVRFIANIILDQQ